LLVPHEVDRLPRYCEQRKLPPYSYVPGRSPHPASDERGSSFGHHEPPASALDESSWRNNETWLFALDLFNHGYFWEAHEAWESLWHAAGRRGPTADFLKGLIKLAAAGVKAREGRPNGVRLHAARAGELLSPNRGRLVFGVAIDELLAAAQFLQGDADRLAAQPGNAAVLPLMIRLANERITKGRGTS
jgi:hypothetical protein